MRSRSIDSSCPRTSPSKTGVNALMSRASTSCFPKNRNKQDVAGRDKSGHDVGDRSRPISALIASIITVAATLMSSATAARAQEAVADFYKGKSIRFVIGAISGGGNDTYARLVGRHLGKFIPGQPAIVPINMPGASGHVSAAHIYNVAAKDGTAIGATTPGVLTEPLWAGEAGRAKYKYDPTQMIHLGSAQAATYNCYVRADAPAKTIQEAMTTEVILGANAEGGSSRDAPVLLNNVLGTKFRMVTGYPGTREILIAMERNEVHGVCGTGWDAMISQRPDWLENGFIRVLVQENIDGSPLLNKLGVPRSIDLAKTDEARQIIQLAYAQQAFGRPYILPPGTPADRVAALRKAFMAATQDADLLAEAQKMRVEVRPLSGEAIEAMVNKMYALPRDIIERTRDALIYRPPT
jgi:tripartite-type tricarboxylate transporter receptor subunit TctC